VTSVAAILAAPPLLALCLDCLAVATGRRFSMIFSELEQLGPNIEIHSADCGHCHLAGPVFRKVPGSTGATGDRRRGGRSPSK